MARSSPPLRPPVHDGPIASVEAEIKVVRTRDPDGSRLRALVAALARETAEAMWREAATTPRTCAPTEEIRTDAEP